MPDSELEICHRHLYIIKVPVEYSMEHILEILNIIENTEAFHFGIFKNISLLA